VIFGLYLAIVVLGISVYTAIGILGH
jgi:hypothetical protein